MRDKRSAKIKHNDGKKGISIGALIVCFIIACGIWLYAQATDDEIKIQTYNQLPVTIVGTDALMENTGYEVYYTSAQTANISISGTIRELAKYDAEDIYLRVDVSGINSNSTDNFMIIRAYLHDGTELKNVEINPSGITVYADKSADSQVSFTVKDVTVEKNPDYDYGLSCLTQSIAITGPEQYVNQIHSACFEIDYQTVSENRVYSGFTLSFYDMDGNPVSGEFIKYDTSVIEVSLTVTPKNIQE